MQTHLRLKAKISRDLLLWILIQCPGKMEHGICELEMGQKTHLFERSQAFKFVLISPLPLLLFYLCLHLIRYGLPHFPLWLLTHKLKFLQTLSLAHPELCFTNSLGISQCSQADPWSAILLFVWPPVNSSVAEANVKGFRQNRRAGFPICRGDSSCLFVFSLPSSLIKVWKTFQPQLYSCYPESFPIKSNCER